MMNTTYKGLHVSWWAVPTDERATVTQAWEACVNKPICSLPERLAMIKIIEDYNLYGGQKLCPSCKDGFTDAMNLIGICVARWKEVANND